MSVGCFSLNLLLYTKLSITTCHVCVFIFISSDLVSYYAYNETDIVPEGNCSTGDNGTTYTDQCVGGLTKLHMYYIFLVCYLNSVQ